MSGPLLSGGFDQLDHTILEELQQNGRISVADLARKIHLSQPAVHNRIKRLERAGIISQYVALVDREAAGFDLMCFIRVTIQPHTREHFACWEESIKTLAPVLECHHMTGGCDLLLKVVMRNHKALDEFISEHLMSLPGVERIETNVVLNTLKATTALTLEEN
jgi:Lrp/AsnC family transcriptional regulator, leucine-responsive regulatory protein